MATAATKEAPKPKGHAGAEHDPDTGEVIEHQKKGTALVAQDEFDYGEDIGAGYENQTSEDVSIPFMAQMQPLSPEVVDTQDKSPEEQVRAGSWINRATGEQFLGAEGFTFIPATTEHVLTEWKPNRGGYVGRHAIDSELAKKVRGSQEFASYKNPENGNDLTENFYVYGLALGKDGSFGPAVLSFASTSIKVYKDWMYRARSIVLDLGNGKKLTRLPLFAHAWNIKTRYPMMKNDQGSWYLPEVRFADPDGAGASRLSPKSDLYQAAKAVHEAVSAGRATADTSTLQGEGSSEAETVRGQKAPATQEGAPY